MNLCASILTGRLTFKEVAQLLFAPVAGKTCYFYSGVSEVENLFYCVEVQGDSSPMHLAFPLGFDVTKMMLVYLCACYYYFSFSLICQPFRMSSLEAK